MLSHAVVAGPAAQADRTVWILHGILGSGRNWRAFARRLIERCPTWRVALVDLRHHGDSHDQHGPDTNTGCAQDLVELGVAIGAPRVVIGHSFGGKVTLGYAALRPAGLAAVWVLDAIPVALGADALDDEVLGVLAQAAAMTPPFRSHEEVHQAFRVAGFSELLAGWMTTNVHRVEGGLTWRFDLEGARALLLSYAETDFTSLLAAPPMPIHLVRGGRSSRWTPAVLDSLSVMGNDRLTVHLMPDAGHWLHVDDPETLLAMLAAGLQDTEGANQGMSDS